jgi:signal transduction histidine kinase
VAQSYNKQKRFIADAGHEIKTPLTIINANTDILEMEVGKSESLDDIKAQIKRLSELTNDLIYLARMEEECTLLSMTDVPVSEIIKDTVSQFKAPAMTMGKTITLEAPPELFVRANAQALQHLISILIDNALKYSPDGSNVFLSVEKAGKHTRISVSNEALPDIRREDIDLFFERFYRADFSRNSATGGHGIGLSIAQAIVNAHGGKISAALKDDNVFCVIVSLG